MGALDRSQNLYSSSIHMGTSNDHKTNFDKSLVHEIDRCEDAILTILSKHIRVMFQMQILNFAPRELKISILDKPKALITNLRLF